MKHYHLDDYYGRNSSDHRFTMADDPENELVSFTAGWKGLSRGYYVQVSKRGHCVVAFGTTKRSALRYARRAWCDTYTKFRQDRYGYPRVVECYEQ